MKMNEQRGIRMIIIHAVSSVNPEKEQAYVEEIQSLVKASRAESGNIAYDFYKSVETEHAYIMVEVWKDQEAVAVHNSSEHFTSFIAKAKAYLTAPLEVKVYSGSE